jgi:glycosyltransferase involved in cell wall biosynthesis
MPDARLRDHLNPMRVLQIHARYRESGGEDRVVEAEADVLRGAGHEVQLVEGRNAEGTPRAAAQLAASLWNPISQRRVARALASFRPDVVHVHNTWFSLTPAVILTAARAGAPVVATLHNYRLACSNALLFRDGRHCEDCVGTHPWHGLVHRCYRKSTPGSLAAASNIALHRGLGTWVRHVDRFLVLSEFARSVMLRTGLPPDKLVVKPNFVRDSPPRSGPPSAGNRVLFVGRLSVEKGVRGLLDAWHAADVEGLELVLIGTGPLESELQGLAGPGVILAGRMEPAAVRVEMGRARALVLPSISPEGAGQPLAVMEALAAGLPVVASRVGGLAAVPDELGEGFSAPALGLTAWAAALTGLRDDQRVDRAGALARSIYEARFTPEVGLTALERAYSLD